ncbi:protein-disulfide reductase DsbD domain-containing protein [Mesorhizobium sp. SB112]|uniref:protein-disulfide reductase DsbD domain-containing protein n=1 Tax=Mesorhizobium sp. SB112 TaxID=3151853 RepID=UPI0032645BA6
MNFYVAPLLIAASLIASQAVAASTDWYKTEGARIRLVTAGEPDSEGNIRGVLDIQLQPGWKTYWKDPGDSGVPPEIDISKSENVADAKLEFPVPQRHDDGYSIWAGYDHPVSLPITFKLHDKTVPTKIDAGVFLGVCQSICVPVQADFVLNPNDDASNMQDTALIDAAYSALPAPARKDFSAEIASSEEERFVVKAILPADSGEADLFIAAPEGYSFAAPKRSDKGGEFIIDILGKPKGTSLPPLSYTLATKNAAVSGAMQPR